jgi:hypothetical protein
MVFRTLFAAIITADSTKKEPKLAAIAKTQLENDSDRKTPPNNPEPKISKATPKLAPEEIPNTKGPANGFRNKVCISKPQIDNPEPTIMAVIAFGKRKLTMIVCQLSLEAIPPIKELKMSLIGIDTEPKLIFRNKNRISKTDKIIKCFVYFFEEFNSS